MATNFNFAPQGVGPGGSAYDPVMRAIGGLRPMNSTNSPAAGMFEAQAFGDNLLKYHPLFQQQNQMGDAMGLLNAVSGMGGGGGGPAPGLGDFESFFNRVRDPLMASLAPGEDRARQQIKNRLLAEGGANALSSGQGMAAMGNLEGELGGVREGALAKALQDSLGQFVNMRGQDVQANQAANQFRYSLLQAILGPMVQGMFQR